MVPDTVALPAAVAAREAAEPAAPTVEEVEEAVRTLIRWAGDDPGREGLSETPTRVAKAFTEFFDGYGTMPHSLLKRTFTEVEGYQDIVVLRDVSFESHCEHHMVPIIGHVHMAYLPDRRVVGISKLARVVDAYAHRLQIQERLTAQIGDTINDVLRPRGVAVLVESSHHCMTTRGVHKEDAKMATLHMLGEFQTDSALRAEFFRLIGR